MCLVGLLRPLLLLMLPPLQLLLLKQLPASFRFSLLPRENSRRWHNGIDYFLFAAQPPADSFAPFKSLKMGGSTVLNYMRLSIDGFKGLKNCERVGRGGMSKSQSQLCPLHHKKKSRWLAVGSKLEVHTADNSNNNRKKFVLRKNVNLHLWNANI